MKSTNYLKLTVEDIHKDLFQQLIDFAIADGVITGCVSFKENKDGRYLITTIHLNPSELEPPQTLKDEVFDDATAKAYLLGLLRGTKNGRFSSNMFFDMNSGWHRISLSNLSNETN